MMEKLVLNLTLKEIMIRKVVIRLWSVDESFDLVLVENYRFVDRDGLRDRRLIGDYAQFVRERGLKRPPFAISECQEWREAIEKVKVKVKKLGVPASLEEKMMLVVKPIGLEMLRWKVSLLKETLSGSRRDVDLQMLKQLHWTNAGALDYEKTAEKVVRLETLDVVKRFRFACLHFLVDHIPDLWAALPVEYQECFSDEESDLRLLVRDYEEFWYRTLTGKQPEEEFSELFQTSVLERANKAEIKYFLRKLSQVERDSCLCPSVSEVAFGRFPGLSFSYFPRECYSGILFDLFSEMSREEVEKVLKEDPCRVLGCFLDWPLQDLLPDAAAVVWPYIPESKYGDLCDIMNEHLTSSDYYFPDAFQKFFQRSPAAFRRFFLENADTFISEFVKTEDAGTIVAMLRSFDVEERVELIAHVLCSSYSIFTRLVMCDDCDFVKLCLRKALGSAEDRGRVRRSLMARVNYQAFLMGEDSAKCRLRKWIKVFESLEDGASAVDKRSSDKASARVKKPRTGKKRRRRN